MNYSSVHSCVFLRRPNRFIAHCLLEGREIICHVKNTGRCKELLVPGCTVYVQHQPSPTRKTQYDLIAVEKGDLLINMDSSAPNKLFLEALRQNQVPLEPLRNLTHIQAEKTYHTSRFDFYVEKGDVHSYGELKGVTLEQDGLVLFPDAPTERGVRHIHSLIEAKKEGYDAYLIFIVQMSQARLMRPNMETHPAFGQAMALARDAGVSIHAFTCQVTPDSLSLSHEIPVELD